MLIYLLDIFGLLLFAGGEWAAIWSWLNGSSWRIVAGIWLIFAGGALFFLALARIVERIEQLHRDACDIAGALGREAGRRFP